MLPNNQTIFYNTNNTTNNNHNTNNNNNHLPINAHLPPYSILSAFYALSSNAVLIEEVNKTKSPPQKYNSPGRPLCMEDRKRIVRLYEEGNRVSHIARIIGVTHSCVSKIMSRYRRTGSVQPRSARNVEQINYPVIKKQTPLPFSIERILSDSKPPSQNMFLKK